MSTCWNCRLRLRKPAEAPPAVLQVAFPNGEIAPPKFDVTELKETAHSIALRKTNLKAKQLTEAASSADALWTGFRNMFMMPMAHMMNAAHRQVHDGSNFPISYMRLPTPQQQPPARHPTCAAVGSGCSVKRSSAIECRPQWWSNLLKSIAKRFNPG